MSFRVSQQRISWMARVCAATCLLMSSAGNCGAALYINEIFFDPGGAGLDTRDEYIELRGDPNMSLDNHYLILIENEDEIAHDGSTGEIENFFTFGDDPFTPALEAPIRIGSNGFLTIRQGGNVYFLIGGPPAGTTNLVNTGGGLGWGSGSTSSVRHVDQEDDGKTENSGFTAMLIRRESGPEPSLGYDLDFDNDGLDHLSTGGPHWVIDDPNTGVHWTVLDAIGVFSEPGEAGLGRLYAPINFGPEIPGQPLSPSNGGVDDGMGNFVFQPRIEPGTTYIGLDFEIEYLGRWGNSTGQTPDDWHASNLTDNSMSGSSGVPDFRQSGGLHDPTEPDTRVETSQGVPYGTRMVHTLGRPNLFYHDGDFDLDGDVDDNDLAIWDAGYGYGTGLGIGSAVTALRTDGDTNGDWIVDGLDFLAWQRNFGIGLPLSATSASIPEPASLALLSLGIFHLAVYHRRLF